MCTSFVWETASNDDVIGNAQFEIQLLMCKIKCIFGKWNYRQNNLAFDVYKSQNSTLVDWRASVETMVSQRFLLLWAVSAITALSFAPAQADLPTVTKADCEKILQKKFERCLKIEFKSDGDLVEYAGLVSQDNFPRILAGQVFNSDLDVIPDSYVTVSIGKDGTTAQVSLDLVLKCTDKTPIQNTRLVNF